MSKVIYTALAAAVVFAQPALAIGGFPGDPCGCVIYPFCEIYMY
jgi:hypothetical protein